MSANQIQIRRVREVTAGTLPATNMKIHPFESFKLTSRMSREQPGDVVSDRTVTDNPETDIAISGSGGADFRYDTHDELWEEAFCNTFSSSYTTTATTIAAVASGNKLTNSAGWAGLAAGDFVLVSGFTTSNTGTWVARVTGVSGNDLTLDADWKTLVDETAGDSVTVMHSGILQNGTSLLTASYEQWNASTSLGIEYNHVGVSQWTHRVPHPNICKQGFSFVGGDVENPLSGQLANSDDAAGTTPIIRSGTDFLDKLNAASGFGIRYDGTLFTDIRIKNLAFAWDNPLSAAGGAGPSMPNLGPQDLILDGRFNCKVDLELYREGTDSETLIADAATSGVSKSLAYGFRDGNGNRILVYIPAAQPGDGDSTTGVAQSGREMVPNISFLAKNNTTHGMCQIARFAAS